MPDDARLRQAWENYPKLNMAAKSQIGTQMFV